MLHRSLDVRPAQSSALEDVPLLPDASLAGDVTLPPRGGAAAVFSRNSAISVGRLLASTLVALVLPAYLSHKLPVKTYSAWILILQMSAYVGYLDLGVQTGIAKYVAEYVAKRDLRGANMRASAGLAILSIASVLGFVLTLILAWQVPRIFGGMPPALFHDVRLSLILVGFSLCFGLVCAVPSAIFLGLQRYGVPTVLGLVNRLLYTLVILVAVYRQSSLAAMGALVAGVNVITGLLQVVAWRRLAGHIHVSLAKLDRAVVRQMLSYCSVLAIWTAGMLCVSGLDVTIVGHYDFGQTAFYSIATLPTNFVIAMMGAALGPLLPTASALSAERSAAAMGQVLARVTRYSVLLLGLSGLPLLVCGHWLLRLWVGQEFALHSIAFLRVLVVANIIRNLCLPYATMLVATGRQKVAIAGAVAEALVNVAASIYFAQRMGAIGVAIGTLLGSLVSVGMHFGLSMHFTYRTFAITRLRLLLSSIMRPAIIFLPSLLCVGRWWNIGAPAFSPISWAAWTLSTLGLGWFAGLERSDRTRLLGLL